MAEMQDLSIDDILPRNRVKKSEVSFLGSSVLDWCWWFNWIRNSETSSNG